MYHFLLVATFSRFSSLSLSFSHPLSLADIEAVVKGKHSAIFHRKIAKHSNANMCFSIIGTHRTLDLQATTMEERDMWIAALIAVVAKWKLGENLFISDREIEQLRSLERDKLHETRIFEFLSAGQQLKKHGRHGKPKDKWISVSQGKLYWVSGTLVGKSLCLSLPLSLSLRLSLSLPLSIYLSLSRPPDPVPSSLTRSQSSLSLHIPHQATN